MNIKRQAVFKESGVCLTNNEWLQLLCKIIDEVNIDNSICTAEIA